MIDAGNVTIVDVRTPDEFAEKHIPDAINIPVESIGTEKPDGLPDLDAVILVYCRTGIRAANASGKLADIGYTQIYDMVSGHQLSHRYLHPSSVPEDGSRISYHGSRPDGCNAEACTSAWFSSYAKLLLPQRLPA